MASARLTETYSRGEKGSRNNRKYEDLDQGSGLVFLFPLGPQFRVSGSVSRV